MPNYRNKNRNKRNKNRNKQQQQQQQQHQQHQKHNQNKNANEQQQQEEETNKKEQSLPPPAKTQKLTDTTTTTRVKALSEVVPDHEHERQPVGNISNESTIQAIESTTLASAATETAAATAAAPSSILSNSPAIEATHEIVVNSNENASEHGNAITTTATTKTTKTTKTTTTIEQGRAEICANTTSNAITTVVPSNDTVSTCTSTERVPAAQNNTTNLIVETATTTTSKGIPSEAQTTRTGEKVGVIKEGITGNCPNMGEQHSKLAAPTTGSTTTAIPSKSGTVPRVLELQPLRHSPPQGKVIVHRIIRESESDSPVEQTQQVRTNEQAKPTVQAKSRSISPVRSDEEARSIIQTKPRSTSPVPSNEKAKVIIHRIILEDEEENDEDDGGETSEDGTVSPLSKSGILIQEVSDASLSDYNDNPPLISEAESEPESTLSPTPLDGNESDAHIVAIKTLPLNASGNSSDEEELRNSCISIVQEEEARQRRVHTRAALEAHFRPQFLSPRYLDSIIEENSDMSDAHSDCSTEQPTKRHSTTTDENDIKAKRANAVFPKSNLDFSKKHKHGPVPKAPQLVAVIREEPPMLMVATKFVDQVSAASESCTRVDSVFSPESEAAEVVYINSASSSASDLRDLDLDEWSNDAIAESRMEVDLDTDVNEIIAPPSTQTQTITYTETQKQEHANDRERTPVNHTSPSPSSSPSSSSSSSSPPINDKVSEFKPENTTINHTVNNQHHIDRDLTELTHTPTRQTAPSARQLASCTSEWPQQNSRIISNDECSSGIERNDSESSNNVATPPSTLLGQSQSSLPANASAAENPKQSNSYSLRAEHFVQPGVFSENFTMNSSVREFSSNSRVVNVEVPSYPSNVASNIPYTAANAISNSNAQKQHTNLNANFDPNFATTTITTATSTVTQSGKRESPTPPPIPPPPSLLTQLSPVPVQFSDTKSAENPLQSLSKDACLIRQESADSHCSDSTNHSQCTAINVGDFDVTSPISEKFPTNWPTDSSNAATQYASAQDSSIKKLRLLCAETVASMPYGEEMLEELATVAQNIGEVSANAKVQGKTPTSANNNDQEQQANMPYPLPQLPHIDELQLSLANTDNQKKALQTVVLSQLPPPPPPSSVKTDSPSPPPVPTRPVDAESAPWLALPTNADPKLLVCLSPAQQSYMQTQKVSADNQPDRLLDAHQKFVERRGYHEYSAEQVKALNTEQLEEQRILETAAMMKKLRKSLTPTPPPIPPPPVPVKSSQTAAKAQNQTKTTTTTTTITTAPTAATTANDYGIANFRNANEPATVCSANSEQAFEEEQQNKHRLLAIIHDTTQMPKAAVDASSSILSSSHENSSRQETVKQGVPLQSSTTASESVHITSNKSGAFNMDTGAGVTKEQPEISSSFPITSMKSRQHSMLGIESELGKMFPTLAGNGDIFDGTSQRRYSNIESSNATSQILQTQPKRYSSYESSKFESKKRTENGQVVYDYATRQHESRSDGDKTQENPPVAPFANKSAEAQSTTTATFTEKTAPPPPSQTTKTNAEEIMSAFKLKMENASPMVTPSTTAATTAQQSEAQLSSNNTEQQQQQQREALRREYIKNRQMSEQFTSNKDISSTYEEFRQRAKAAAEAITNQPASAPPLQSTTTGINEQQQNKSAFNFDHEKLIKDFDDLSKQLHMELESGKAKRMQYEKANSLYDLSRLPTDCKNDFAELKQRRHEHMQELEREIERSMRSRQSLFSPTSRNTGQEQPTAGTGNVTSRTYEIPIRLEGEQNGYDTIDKSATIPKTYQIPVQIEQPSKVSQPVTPQTSYNIDPHTPRTYEIPVQLEEPYKVSQPVTPQNQNYEEYDKHYRRAESMFDLSDNVAQSGRPRSVSMNYGDRQNVDDWSRYASDLGYSENIAKPFAREVEICYQRVRPNTIRAPRLTVSTNDLFSQTPYFDTYNAYGARRTQAPMLNQVPQKSKPQYQSCYSVLERDPNPTYISTTARRGVSPAPPPTATTPSTENPTAYNAERQQRRASLPREIHEQQLKYITSKEDELRTEFERLQNERRRLLEEMTRASNTQLPQRPVREHYRPPPRLPTLSEDEVFRQQMAQEWLNKVAEREERRLQKIIKISKVHEDEARNQFAQSSSNISDEFLNRVKERRTKLAMPSDSDWESGAESQPVGQTQNSETEEPPTAKVIEGKTETDFKHLPKHLREFARFSNHQSEKLDGGHREVHEEEERRHEATGNTLSSAMKKSSVVKTVKISGPSYANANGRHKQETKQNSQQFRRSASTHTSHTSNISTSRHQRQSVEMPAAIYNTTHAQRSNTNTNSNSNSNASKPFKRTRFQHMPISMPGRVVVGPSSTVQNRRSWSESDLLQEIDKELKLAKGFLFADVYKVKHEYMSEPETENDRPRKMAQLGRRQYDGIGPVTNDGMPIILRSEVKEPHQHEWYKRLYQTIHKQKNGAGRHQYKTSGYQSEPEPNYDSDYSIVKYRTLNQRRLQPVSSATNVRNETSAYHSDKFYGTMPNPIKSGQNTYKNQPGRIEDYVTGRSSVSEKERKEWWDEVMDIFNGHLEQSKLSPHYTEGNLSRALAKESGYTSDSNLVFRKRELQQSSPLSPVEQKQAYKSVQAGGEPPLFGFRKPAPEKPREAPNRYLESDVNIHFKTPVRHEYKHPIPDDELAIRQAEQMQKLYQEERRRKYLQELQDMNARRHTDNFTPTQKSPIPLNRYDDFQSDLQPKSPNLPTYRKMPARALYNFQGQNARELTFRKGDIIYIRRQIDKNWYEGEHNAMIGLFPVTYVEVVNKDVIRQQPKKPSEGQARAKYNFQAQSGVELSLNKGELVTLTRRVDENWFEGKIANRKGIFPVSYVEVLTDIGAEDRATKTVIAEHSTTNMRPSLDTLRTNINNEFNLITQNGHQPPNGILKETRSIHKTDVLHVDTSTEPLVYRALYKYRPQNSDELELLEGDIVHVLEKCDDGWFVGTSQRTGCFGTFPGNYVERV